MRCVLTHVCDCRVNCWPESWAPSTSCSARTLTFSLFAQMRNRSPTCMHCHEPVVFHNKCMNPKSQAEIRHNWNQYCDTTSMVACHTHALQGTLTAKMPSLHAARSSLPINAACQNATSLRLPPIQVNTTRCISCCCPTRQCDGCTFQTFVSATNSSSTNTIMTTTTGQPHPESIIQSTQAQGKSHHCRRSRLPEQSRGSERRQMGHTCTRDGSLRNTQLCGALHP